MWPSWCHKPFSGLWCSDNGARKWLFCFLGPRTDHRIWGHLPAVLVQGSVRKWRLFLRWPVSSRCWGNAASGTHPSRPEGNLREWTHMLSDWHRRAPLTDRRQGLDSGYMFACCAASAHARPWLLELRGYGSELLNMEEGAQLEQNFICWLGVPTVLVFEARS